MYCTQGKKKRKSITFEEAGRLKRGEGSNASGYFPLVEGLLGLHEPPVVRLVAPDEGYATVVVQVGRHHGTAGPEGHEHNSQGMKMGGQTHHVLLAHRLAAEKRRWTTCVLLLLSWEAT